MKPLVKNSVFMFPGQGVPAREICDYFTILNTKDAAKTQKYAQTLQNSLDEINPQGKFEVFKILADNTSDAWNKTDFVQPLIYTLCIITFELMKEKPKFVLGHSLGAFTALTASGAMPFERGCRIVAARGKYMQEASTKQETGMIAVIGIEEDKIQEICNITHTVIALMNAPTAYVIGAPRKLFGKIEEEAVRLGVRKTIILPNSGAFHTAYMREAYEKFNEFIKGDNFEKPLIPVVTNMKGKAFTDPAELKKDIIDSMIHPVNWIRMMEFLKNQNAGSFVEVGPGSSLSILARMNGVDRDKITHARTILE